MRVIRSQFTAIAASVESYLAAGVAMLVLWLLPGAPHFSDNPLGYLISWGFGMIVIAAIALVREIKRWG